MMGTLIFLATIHSVNDWLIDACRHMNRGDAITVWLIFGVIVVFDFIPGIILGIIWTSMVFIVRFSKIDVVGSSYSLNELSSSVERSARERKFLQEYGKDVKIFNLRGYLFFGSANMFFERIKAICEEKKFSYIIFDFKRVFGTDSTTSQVFVKLITLLESEEIKPVFCGMNRQVSQSFEIANVFEAEENKSLVLSDLDLALKWVEERLLADRSAERSPMNIHEILEEILGNCRDVEQLVMIMDRLPMENDEYLFHQGDAETSIYIIESGTIEVRLEDSGGKVTRLREFRRGSMLGEMASHTDVHKRTAAAVAIEQSVVYRLEPDRIPALGERALECDLLLHELIARQLASRLSFMNERTQADL